MAKRNTFKIADLKPLVQESLNSITADNWKNAVRHSEGLQVNDEQRDMVIDHYLDSFTITLSSDEESS